MTVYMSNEAIVFGVVGCFIFINLAINIADFVDERKHISIILTFATCLWIVFSYLIIFGYAKNPFL